jgi:hypothetical protein
MTSKGGTALDVTAYKEGLRAGACCWTCPGSGVGRLSPARP